ncbi:chemotaxis protein CheA [Rhodoferax lacus]|uniref:Chemotaxis protein CheA n=2 Tax=Rhodoferax lacus TaxID=2184758 RepID=A0A3E1REL0_9BURK|nr:chemotaxis protein CheA [Rhodoferax lacus]
MDALPAFISEAAEQTEAIEALLLEIEESPNDRELLNSLFRCAHTVKGSAGLFGLDRVVEFTHHVETLLDHMREGRIVFNQAIGTLLLECNDQIRFLIEMGFDDEADTAEQQALRLALVLRLKALCSPHEAAPTVVAVPVPAVPAQEQAVWRISAHFGPDTFRGGMDPMAVARYLGTLGQVLDMQWNMERVPPIDALVHDSCYISFALQLQSGASQADLEEAFSFVEDDCEFRVQAEESAHEKIQRNIEDLSEVPRLGDLLMAAGAVSQTDLHAVLQTQARAQAEGAEPGLHRLGALLVEQAGVDRAHVDAALGKQQKIRDKHSADEGRFIRVQAERLDTVINLLGELVIAGAGSGAALSAFENLEPDALQTLLETLIESNQNMNRLIEEIRNSTLGLRMVPVGETFTRFKRVVRDTASSLGKEVQFDIVGGETELDKSMVEKIADPLMHLVRNSLDHGLETPASRIAAGKPALGHLTLSARHEAGSILIRIEDDGRGINRDRVLQRAWDKGLVEPGVVPGDDAINMLIFEPGFSTAEQVTNLSGRGVGMDVVRSNIEALRGTLRLDSRPGRGLTVDIRLPLTLAIIDGFLVGVGDAKFVLPLQSVVEVIESEDQSGPVDQAGRHCVELRGAVLPVLRLKSLYGMDAEPTERVSIVVVQSGTRQYGIEVEALLGQHQTVIKPLGELFKTVRGLSGSAILGSGEVALIIDVPSLGQLASAPPARSPPVSEFSRTPRDIRHTRSIGEAA